MENIASVENITLEGTFGDKKVLVCRCAPNEPNGVNIALMHGVHSSANFHRTNKFRALAECLAGAGFSPWLIETSRKVRNRHDYAGDWVEDAFGGKTFPQEQEDVFAALRHIIAAVGDAALWIWGFSLGGIIALSAAASDKFARRPGKDYAFDALVLGGTGLVSYPEVEEHMLKLPVLSTLRAVLSPDMVSEIKTGMFISFRGENDEIFPKEQCVKLVDDVPLPADKKYFYPVPGADHGLRVRDGKNDPSVMQEMTEVLKKALKSSLW